MAWSAGSELQAQTRPSGPPSAPDPEPVAVAPEQPKRESGAPLSKGATEALVARYAEAKHWLQKTLSLLSLTDRWHPCGNQMILQALQQRDPRLQAFAIEVLLATEAERLPAHATAELLDELIGKQLLRDNDYYQKRVRLALELLVPNAKAGSPREWASWWSDAKGSHGPAQMPKAAMAEAPPAKTSTGATSAAQPGVLQRYVDGLDIVICIDTTSGMQPMMRSLSDALAQMIEIAPGISPKMRLGVVQFKDYGELGKPGVRVVQALTKNFRSVYKKVAKLNAFGGNDMPEAVFGGVQLALGKSMKWSRNANKVLVLISDAPPHDRDRKPLMELVRIAYEDPSKVDAGKQKARTGMHKPVHTSTIGVVVKAGPDVKLPKAFKDFLKSQAKMQEDFAALAKIGHGVFLTLEWLVTNNKPLTKKQIAAIKPSDMPGVRATRRIVETLLRLSFGDRRQHEITDYMRVFYAYKDAGWIK